MVERRELENEEGGIVAGGGGGRGRGGEGGCDWDESRAIRVFRRLVERADEDDVLTVRSFWIHFAPSSLLVVANPFESCSCDEACARRRGRSSSSF